MTRDSIALAILTALISYEGEGESSLRPGETVKARDDRLMKGRAEWAFAQADAFLSIRDASTDHYSYANRPVTFEEFGPGRIRACWTPNFIGQTSYALGATKREAYDNLINRLAQRKS